MAKYTRLICTRCHFTYDPSVRRAGMRCNDGSQSSGVWHCRGEVRPYRLIPGCDVSRYWLLQLRDGYMYIEDACVGEYKERGVRHWKGGEICS